MGWKDAPTVAGGGWKDAPMVKQPEVVAQKRERDEWPGISSAMNIAQAPTFGFADELYGAASTLGGGDYTENRDAYRARVEQFKKEYPKSAMLGTISGGLATGLAGAKVIPGALAAQLPKWVSAPQGLAQTMGSTAAIGGVSGAAQGTGEAESRGDIASGAGLGAMAGIIGGPAVLGIGKGVVGVGKKLAGPFVQRVANKLASGKVAEALIRDMRAAMPGLEDVADDKVLDMAIKKASGRLNQLGPKAVLADAGPASGENTRNLLDTVATLPGKSQGAVSGLQHARKANIGRDLQAAAATGLSPWGMRAGDLVGELVEQQKVTARPLYAELYGKTVPNISTGQYGVRENTRLTQLLDGAEKIGALKEAANIATSEVAIEGNKAAFTLSPRGDSLSMRDLDRVKQGLDQLIRTNTKEGQLTPKGLSILKLKNEFVKYLDEVVPEYKIARDAFSGPAALIDAASKGRKALAHDDAYVRGLMGNMSESELNAFRVGAFESLRDKMGTQGGRTQIMNMWQESKTADKLKEVFGSERKFREFAAEVAKESRMKRLNIVGQGSQTARRLAGEEDLAAGVGETVAAATAAKTGNIGGIAAAAGKVWGRLSAPEKVRDEIGKTLLSRPTAGQFNALKKDFAEQSRINALSSAGVGTAAPAYITQATQ